MLPADRDQSRDQSEMRKTRQHSLQNLLGLVTFQLARQRSLVKNLSDGPVLTLGARGRGIRGLSGVRRISCNPFVAGEANGLGEQQPEDADGQARARPAVRSGSVPGAVCGSARGRNQTSAASQHADPTKSSANAIGGCLSRLATEHHQAEGLGASSSNRSRLRTLQMRLNLKKSVTHPTKDRNAQTSGLIPRSATSDPLTSASFNGVGPTLHRRRQPSGTERGFTQRNGEPRAPHPRGWPLS